MARSDDTSAWPLLARVGGPRDLEDFTPSELVDLAAEIRSFLVTKVARTGGHLGPNLGVIELTIAIHRVFDSPYDSVVFDTGHQAYVHKLLTGRHDFDHLREKEGLSGYPSRVESDHDIVENSHASASLSWADGISRYRHIAGIPAKTVAVIGDGALTGGMAWEALNNIADGTARDLVIVVNDNGRSYAPTIGGLAHHLDALRTSPEYERTLSWAKKRLLALGDPGRAAFDALHGLKTGIKDVIAPQALFEDLGIKYLGPIDGHDLIAMEHALTRARDFREPVIVHAITEKGRGYVPAEEDIADRFHAVGPIHPETGLPVKPARFGWTAVFAEEIAQIAREDERVVGVTAAMMLPVGLGPMAREFPDRVIDVGIAEQHAVTSAAGMAFAGAHPVFAVYATFLNRAFDQVLMDAGLHHEGVTVVLDRAGVTGDDGPSHNGMWDISMLSVVPGLRLAAPRDEPTLREELREAIAIDDAPSVLRYPKGSIPDAVPASRRVDGVDILDEDPTAPYGAPHADDEAKPSVLMVACGPFAQRVLQAAHNLRADGTARVTVVDPRWLLPLPDGLAERAADYDLVVTVEDGIVVGGFGWALRDAMASSAAGVVTLGVPREFLEQAPREDILSRIGLDAAGIAGSVRDRLSSRASVRS